MINHEIGSRENRKGNCDKMSIVKPDQMGYHRY